MPDLNDFLNHASDELATMPVPARPFIPQPRRVGPALVVVALLAGAGGLTAIVRSQSAPDHMLVANTPTTTATSTVQTSDGTASTSVTEPPGTATPQTSVTPATTTPVLTTSDPLAFTQPQQVISGATGGWLGRSTSRPKVAVSGVYGSPLKPPRVPFVSRHFPTSWPG